MKTSGLLEALRYYITRDAAYVAGGSTVILSVLRLFGKSPPTDLPAPYYLLAATFAYVLGYVIQELLSLLTPLVTTRPILEPGRFVQWLYRHFTKKPHWDPIGEIDLEEALILVNEKASERNIGDLQRIITLKHIGTAIGSSTCVSGILLFVAAAVTPGTTSLDRAFDYFIASAAVLAGVALISLGWLKGAQQSRFVAQCFRNLPQ